MSGPEQFGGGWRTERPEVEQRIQEVCERNQAILESVPPEVEMDAYWGTLRREGVPVSLRVRQSSGAVLEQTDMYLLEVIDDGVRMTYFDEDGVGQDFPVALVDIEAVR